MLHGGDDLPSSVVVDAEVVVIAVAAALPSSEVVEVAYQIAFASGDVVGDLIRSYSIDKFVVEAFEENSQIVVVAAVVAGGAAADEVAVVASESALPSVAPIGVVAVDITPHAAVLAEVRKRDP